MYTCVGRYSKLRSISMEHNAISKIARLFKKECLCIACISKTQGMSNFILHTKVIIRKIKLINDLIHL